MRVNRLVAVVGVDADDGVSERRSQGTVSST